jgi:hypothetical protein
MANLGKIRDRIREMAGRPNGVELAEIEWVVKQLEVLGHRTSSRRNSHQVLFNVDGRRFGVCSHNPRSNQIKACYVKEFLDAMEDLGLYEG